MASAVPSMMQELLDAVGAIGTDLDLPRMLERIVAAAAELADARYGALGVLDDTGTALAEFITVGLSDDEIRAIGHLPKGHGILGLLIVDKEPIRLPDLTKHADSYGFPANHPHMASFLGVPLRVRDEVFGNLYLADKRSGPEFTQTDELLVVGLSVAAGVAIENARLQARVHEAAIVEDRERIARDLHDTVIQRLFATGLSLQGAIRKAEVPEVAERIEAAVEDLDLTVKHIRTAIFGLESSRGRAVNGTRAEVMALCREAAGPLGFEPRVTFEGPIDANVQGSVAVDLLSVVREALSNVARHAHAGRVDIRLQAMDGSLSLSVVDDGVGLADDRSVTGHGLRNLRERAERHGGSFVARPAVPAGTRIEWQVPLL